MLSWGMRQGTPAAGTSLHTISTATGISVSHLSRVFRGERKPSMDVLTSIAAYLGITIDKLVAKLAEKQNKQAA